MGRPRSTPKKSRFGSVDQLPNGKWRARYRNVTTGERPSKIFDTEAEALDWLSQQRVAMATGQYVSPSKMKVKFKTVAEEWQKAASAGKDNTVKGYIGILNSRVLPYWENREIGSITRHDIRKWIKSMEGEVKQSTRNNRRTVLSLVMQTAVEAKYILENPCEDVGAGKADDDPFEAVFLRPEEVNKLADKMTLVATERWPDRDLDYDLPVLVAGFVGLRAGEVWAARTAAIDFERGLFRVRRSVHRGVETLPKAHERRAVPIPLPVLERLREFVERTGRKPDDYLFQSVQGCRIHHSNWSGDYYRPARALCGFKEEPRFHDLRHTCATIYFDAGASAEVVARILGDKVETIRRHYEHVYPEAFERFTTDIAGVVGQALRVMGGADGSQVGHGAKVVDLSLPDENAV